MNVHTAKNPGGEIRGQIGRWIRYERHVLRAGNKTGLTLSLVARRCSSFYRVSGETDAGRTPPGWP